MKIIIIGCGKVGVALAEGLSGEQYDVVLVDTCAEKLQQVTEDLDAMPVVGNGSSIATLSEAGVEDADLLIAVTGSDELNLLCCLIARKQGNCQTVARVRNPVYNKEISFIKESLGISMIINPELAAAMEIARLLRFPSAINIDTFAKGRVELLRFRQMPEFHMDGLTISELQSRIKSQILITGVERGEEAFIPNGDFRLKDGDSLFIIASPQNAGAFFREIGVKNDRVKNCMIVGGGTIAYYLALQLLNMHIRVTIIDKFRERCEMLAETLPGATIICGDGTDKKLLLDEGLEQTEAFVSLTNMDEENILVTLYAKERSKAKLVTKVNRLSFDNLITKLDLGSVIYPKDITADYILRYARAMQNTIGSNVETLYHILDNKAEALEFLIRENSEVVNVPLKDLSLKDNLLVGCINRDGRIMIPWGNDSLQVGDTVIVVTTQKGLRDIRDILKR